MPMHSGRRWSSRGRRPYKELEWLAQDLWAGAAESFREQAYKNGKVRGLRREHRYELDDEERGYRRRRRRRANPSW